VGITPGILFIVAIANPPELRSRGAVHKPKNIHWNCESCPGAMMLQLSDSAHLSEFTVALLDVIFLPEKWTGYAGRVRFGNCK
jgi:hypothetical protein